MDNLHIGVIDVVNAADNQLATAHGVEVLAVTIAVAVKIMGIGRTSVYQLIKSGKLRTIKIAGRRVVALQAIRECLAAHEVTP